MATASPDYSKIEAKTLVYELLPLLILSVLESYKKEDPDSPSLAVFEIVKEIRKRFGYAFTFDSEGKQRNAEDVEATIRPRVYEIMRQFRQEKEEDKIKYPKEARFNFVEERKLKYMITDKGLQELNNYKSDVSQLFSSTIKLTGMKLDE